MLAKFSRIFFLFSLVLLLYSAISHTVGYHDSWILKGIEIPTLLFVFSMVLLFVTGNLTPKWLALYSTVYLCVLNLLPSFRYSLPYGTGDVLTHLGMVREIYITGTIPSSQIFAYTNFPLMHILNASAALITGASPFKIFKFVVPVFMSIVPLVVYIISKRLYSDIRLQRYAIFATLLLFTNYNYFLAPASLATLLMFIVFTFIVSLTVTNRQYVGFSLAVLIALIAIVFMHHFTSLTFLIILLICAAGFVAAPNAASTKKNRLFVFIPIFYITVLFSWWMYNARWVFHLFAVNVKKYLIVPEDSLQHLPIGAAAEKVGINVFIFHHIGAMIITVLSAIGILVLLLDILGKDRKYVRGYPFFFYITLYIAANVLLFIYQAVAGITLINIERMMIFGFLFAPAFIAFSLFKLDDLLGGGRTTIKILFLFLLVSLTLIEFYPSERLLPGNSLNIANSEYMVYMAEFIQDTPIKGNYIIASDEVTRRVLNGFTDYSIWSKYSRSGSKDNTYGLSSVLFLQFLDAPASIKERFGAENELSQEIAPDASDTVVYLLHRPGRGGIIYEFYEANHPQEDAAWIIDRAIERTDVDLIYDNGEAYVILARQK